MHHTSHLSGRDNGLDLLRTIATFRVFLWHATGFAALTFLGAIPVMFWLNGLLLAGSVAKQGTWPVIASRAKRLLIPYWGFGVVMTTVMHLKDRSYNPFRETLTWLLPIGEPVGALFQNGWITEPLWYLRAYTWLLVLAPVLLWAARRHLVATLAGLATGTFLLESLLGVRAWALQDAVTYGFFFTLGIGTALRGEIATRLRRGIGLAAAFLAAVLWQVQSPLDGVVNNSHRIHLLVGIATLAVAQELRGALRNTAEVASVRRVVHFMRNRSLTFYLWHAPLTGLAWVGAGRLGIDSTLLAGTFAVTAGLAATFAACTLFGVLEDLGAGRGTLRLPQLRTAGVGVITIGMLLGTLAVGSASSGALPPTPSRTPEVADFTVADGEAFLLGPTQSALAGTPQGPGVSVGALGIVAPPNRSKDTSPGSAKSKTTRPGATKAGIKVTPAPVLAVPARGATPPVPSWGALAPELPVEKAVLIDEAIARWLRNKPTDGVEIAVLTPGRYRYARGYSADGAPTKNADQIPIHSITKTFTAALILRAVEDGRIRLEDRLGTLTVAPWFTVAEQVTVGQLLSHKSGIVTYTDTKTFKDDWQKIDGWEPALRGAQDAGLAFTPGSKQIYSSTNFIVLGLLAAQIYGLEIEKLIERDLLGPLNLDRTSIARPYPGSPGTGTGNMSAHITDLTRWANAMWREKTVLGAAGNQLTTYVDPVNMLGYGNFAYCPCTKQNGKTIPAAIGGNGAEATMRYYPGIDTIIVLRTPVNGPTKGVEELVTEILRITNS